MTYGNAKSRGELQIPAILERQPPMLRLVAAAHDKSLANTVLGSDFERRRGRPFCRFDTQQLRHRGMNAERIDGADIAAGRGGFAPSERARNSPACRGSPPGRNHACRGRTSGSLVTGSIVTPSFQLLDVAAVHAGRRRDRPCAGSIVAPFSRQVLTSPDFGEGNFLQPLEDAVTFRFGGLRGGQTMEVDVSDVPAGRRVDRFRELRHLP